ncbi:flagellin [Phreatobacter stygius]|nr:flagellin [Phreatobacter stygius]
MATSITLSAGVRSNLLNLQSTAELKNVVQTRLSTGKKVNSALESPTNFFTASSLSSRASDLSNLLDGMANGIQTIQAANNGLTSITTALQSMQSTLNQARQDKSFQSQSYDVDAGLIGTAAAKNLTLSGGAIGTTGIDVKLQSLVRTGNASAAVTAPTAGDIDVTIGTVTKTVTLANGDDITAQIGKINAAFGSTVAANVGGRIALTDASGTAATVADSTGNVNGTAAAVFGAAPVTSYAPKSVDQLVSAINATLGLTGKVTASNDNGRLRLQNISTQEMDVKGVTGGRIDGSASSAKIAGNSVRTSLARQFNELRDQITKFGDDASFNGVNLLRGDNLKLTLNETGTSFINVQARDKAGMATAIDNAFLKTDAVTAPEFDTDAVLDAKLDIIKDALAAIRSISSSFGSQLSSVQNRKDFTKQMINTLQVGADNLTLADTNEEGANLLALNTRQSLQTTSLSFASQADQAVLQFLK